MRYYVTIKLGEQAQVRKGTGPTIYQDGKPVELRWGTVVELLGETRIALNFDGYYATRDYHRSEICALRV